ncbi:EamA family transporter RarD [Fusibacter sp. 3D3]|uniref:EamA family transporter RarD n=1 Tax=Fusibacter sp. 3D3 TaxID=1048380 RepID=UPI000853C482|nr:EamA family transporter RarD [Fusibacter sp. 3D3]GAU77309.1 RarD protein [Fusibacter sp. 3D3]
MDQKKYAEGLAMGGAAFTLWGLLPLYWKLMRVMSPYEIFVQRVVWSFVFVVIILVMKKQIRVFGEILKNPQNWLKILGPALFISINWLVYIGAINNNYVIETSLGYYINPLVLTLFGGIFFKERLTKLQTIGIGFAGVGVLAKTLMYGRVPIIALILAFSFAIYGLLKKQSKLDSLNGLAFETLVVGIPSIFFLVFIEASGGGISGNLPVYYWGLIALSGIVTAVPLLLYAEGAKRLPLSVVGFLQYIAPTIGLILGVFVFKEPFDLKSLIAFAFIWIGLGFFTYSQYQILSQKEVSKIQLENKIY